MRRLSKDYYKALETIFDIRVFKKILRSDDEQIKIFLFRMRLKRQDKKGRTSNIERPTSNIEY